jgi:hypothetical protein
MITSQLRCRSCGTYFEAVRDDFAAAAGDRADAATDRGPA